MNMKKTWKRFFSLDRRHAEGFTLVELIVVIAILAILGGVAVPAYSGYVEKANMQADISLASEVAHALALHYYANPEAATGGYVVLSKDGADGDDFGKAALLASFGEGWETSDALKLKHDGWEYSKGMPSAEDAKKVSNSSYYKNSTPAELVSSFTGLTDALAGMANTASQDPLNTMKSLDIMTDDEYAAMRKQLDDLGVKWESGGNNTAYTTAVSNLLVQNVATEIGGYTYTEEDNVSALGELAVAYAQIYAWGSTGDAQGTAVLGKLNQAIAAEDANSVSVMNAVGEAMNAATADGSSFYDYLEKNEQADLSGLSAIMGTVSGWSEGADMTASGLYSSDSLTGAVNNYVAAVGTMSGMSEENAKALAAALGTGVVVFVSPDGTVGSNID